MEEPHPKIVFYNEDIPEEFTTPATIIRDWYSCSKRKCYDLKIKKQKSEGHSSVELIRRNKNGKFCRGSFEAGTYISAEPKLVATGNGVKALKRYPVHYVPSYKDDLSQHYIDDGIEYEGEGQEPNRTIVIYNLDVDKMANSFLEFIKYRNKHQWKLLVAVLSLSECETEEVINFNCVTLVLAILNIGGFSKLQGIRDQMSGIGISVGAVGTQAGGAVSSPIDLFWTVGRALFNGTWNGIKCISSPVYISPDVFDNRIVSAKKRELETDEGKNKHLITFKNDVSVIDWKEIRRLKKDEIQKYNLLKELDSLESRLNSLPRKYIAEVDEWIPLN